MTNPTPRPNGRGTNRRRQEHEMLKKITQPRGVVLEKNGEPRQSGSWTIQQYLKVDDSDYETVYEHAKHRNGQDKWFQLVDEE